MLKRAESNVVTYICFIYIAEYIKHTSGCANTLIWKMMGVGAVLVMCTLKYIYVYIYKSILVL